MLSCACGRGPELHANGICVVAVLEAARDYVEEDEPIPDQLGDYEIIERIDSGGCSNVFRARRKGSDHEVAVKHLRGGSFAHPQARKHFQDDLAFIVPLAHPNILPVYDTRGIDDEEPHFAMRLIKEGSLDREENRRLFRDEYRAAQLMATVARTVQFCHDAKPHPVIHRDLKPGNILIEQGWHPYLADFGLAVPFDPERMKELPKAGTIEYMSPEQASGREITIATDVYGLGAVLYDLLCGRPPHVGSLMTQVDMLKLVEHGPIVPPHRLVPRVSRELSAIVMTALARAPAQRYPSAGALADDLDRFLRGDAPLLLPDPQHSRWRQWLKRNPWIAGALLASLLVLALFVTGQQQLQQEIDHHQLNNMSQEIRVAARVLTELLRRDLKADGDALAQHAREVEQIVDRAGFAAVALTAVRTKLLEKGTPVDTMTLFDAHGKAQLRAPFVDPPQGKYYLFREYFQAASKLGELGVRGATLGRAHVSESGGGVEFPIVAPLFDRDGRFVGALLALILARAELRSLSKEDPLFGPEAKFSVLAPADVDRALSKRSDARIVRDVFYPQYLYLLHPDMRRGQDGQHIPPEQGPLAHTLARRFRPGRVDERFAKPNQEALERRDTNPAGERALTIYEPLGRSGYLVRVQLRVDQALASIQVRQQRMQQYAIAAVGALLLLWGVVYTRERRREKRNPRR